MKQKTTVKNISSNIFIRENTERTLSQKVPIFRQKIGDCVFLSCQISVLEWIYNLGQNICRLFYALAQSFFHSKWNKTRLSPESECTSCLTSCYRAQAISIKT